MIIKYCATKGGVPWCTGGLVTADAVDMTSTRLLILNFTTEIVEFSGSYRQVLSTLDWLG